MMRRFGRLSKPLVEEMATGFFIVVLLVEIVFASLLRRVLSPK